MKQITLDDFLTPEEIRKAWELFRRLKGTGRFAAAVDTAIVTPNLARINAALGQENDARYLAYAVEYVFSQNEVAHTR
jgi:hypothetical protein